MAHHLHLTIFFKYPNARRQALSETAKRATSPPRALASAPRPRGGDPQHRRKRSNADGVRGARVPLAPGKVNCGQLKGYQRNSKESKESIGLKENYKSGRRFVFDWSETDLKERQSKNTPINTVALLHQ